MHPPLSHRYQDVRPIGAGALTTVLRAWDREANRAVAIKVPIGPLAHDRTFLLRLEREHAALARFAHPNVARLLAVERGGATGFIVVELVVGTSLARMLAARGPMAPAHAARLAATLCAVLAAAHSQGIAHGHLTAGNVLLAADGQLKLTDFRVAKAAEPMPSVPDPAADLRALGRLVAAMLTGREPAEGEPIRLQPTVPAELAAIVSRAAGRGEPYPSAAEIGRDLDRFLATIHPGAVRTAPRAPSAPSGGAASPVAPVDSRSTVLVASPAGSARLRDAGDAARARGGRRRGLALAAGLVAIVLLAGGAVTAGIRLDRDRNRAELDVRQDLAAPPSTAQPDGTIGPLAAGSPTTTGPAATTTATTIAPPATTSPPTATSGPDSRKRTVPDVRGLHRQQAARVLADAQLGVRTTTAQVSDSSQVQRVVAQQPAAGTVVPSGSVVTVVVGTRKASSS